VRAAIGLWRCVAQAAEAASERRLAAKSDIARDVDEGTPRRREQSRDAGIDFAGDNIRELSTVAERYYRVQERPQRPDNYDGYAHVLVDEAQDLSPMQWRMVGRRGGQASWTIVGDAAQSAWPDLGEALRARTDALRGKQIRRFHLRKDSREIGCHPPWGSGL